VLKTALGTVDRMIVFNDLQTGHLPKRQEVASSEAAWPLFPRSGLLNLEETTSYLFDYISTTLPLGLLQVYDSIIFSWSAPDSAHLHTA
jgi:hypothetical protein